MSSVRRRRYALVLALLLLVGATAGVLLYRALAVDLPDLDHPLGQQETPSILITDRQGRLLYEVIDPHGSKYVPLPLADIPLSCQQAAIATEDSHFYSHPGVDPIAIVRAAWLNLRQGETVSGGSTLTQQVARTLYLSRGERNEQSLRRKLREALLAWRLERRYNKNEILALYLNTTYYGHYAVGLEAAAQAYFGSHGRDLDLAQCALLAGIPQFPAGYNPIENPDGARARQAVVLGLMTKSGYISAEVARQAAGERLLFTSSPFPIAAPHFVMWTQSQLETLIPPDQLRALSLSKGGGLRVVTTLDLDWQRQAEDIVARRLAQLRPCTGGQAPGVGCDPEAGPGRRVDDAALVAIDPASGAVRAMVGSADYFDASISGAVNAALSLRQPGSAIKPLTYAAAFDPERGRKAGQQPWTPATLIADVRTVFPTAEGRPYVPQNYDLRYHGPVSARAALANSYNIPAVKALNYIGVDALIEQARRLGIDWSRLPGDWRVESGESPNLDSGAPQGGTLSNLQGAKSFGLALTLGGGEVRLLDLTAAYAAFANGGRRVIPYAIERVETLDGTTVADHASLVLDLAKRDPLQATDLQSANLQSTNLQYPTGTMSLDPRVAYLVTSILSDAEARTPAFGTGSALEIGRPAAAKTGTTTDWRDNWTLGYTPDLAAGVWVGNADNTPMLDITGVTGAGPIWHDFMTSVLRDTPARGFERPDGMVEVEVCADSGLLPGTIEGGVKVGAFTPPSPVSCPNRRLEWFIRGTEPQEVDRAHVAAAIDARTGQRADASTPAAAIRQQITWLMPAELQEWARESGDWRLEVGDSTLPGFSVNESPISNLQSPLTISSPDPNRVYRLDPLLPANVQQMAITARPGPELVARDAPITLLLDGTAVGIVHGPDYTAWWPLVPGQHTVEAVAKGPDNAVVRSERVTIYVNQ